MRALRTNGTVGGVDEGLPIAYQVLDEDVPVYASWRAGRDGGPRRLRPSGGHLSGIAIHASAGQRFVPAAQVASRHEHGVDLGLDGGRGGSAS